MIIKQDLMKLIMRSFLFYRKDAIYQVLIVSLLAAIITGSLFTGYSVRSSLKKTTLEKLGKTDILISSGSRYFDASLAKRVYEATGEKSVSLLETDGYCQNFQTGITGLNTKIYGVSDDFFTFHDVNSVKIDPGTVAINTRLSEHLGIKAGDEIIIYFRDPDPIPANAPFAPSKDQNDSRVIRISRILNPGQAGNFSIGVSQIVPMNIFINSSDLSTGKNKSNRIIIQNSKNYQESYFINVLGKTLKPDDIGLRIRRSAKTGEPELISDRIFIDSAIVEKIMQEIPSASPVITYLANSLSVASKTTPYSFVSAVPSSIYSGINDNEVIINKWLAEDLDAIRGDKLKLTWYNTGFGNLLEEKDASFIISGVIDNDNQLSDPMLMPDFPGISGSSTCSGWDAGVPILLERIRDKDEDYWNKFRGTPKAFINYDTGRKIWGNNFGPATALRFPKSMDIASIYNKLSGSLEPAKTGFTISDLRKTNNKAAAEGIDFSTLFLSLSIFIILSCIILLSMTVSIYFDSRKNQVRTFYALGFKNRLIRKLLFLETLMISLPGAITGALLGVVINMLIVKALNTVWSGAVQTNTLTAHFSLMPLLSGFLITILIASILLQVKVRSFLKSLVRGTSVTTAGHSARQNLILLLLFFSAALSTLLLSLVIDEHTTALSFAGGTFVFLTMILIIRHYFIIKFRTSDNLNRYKNNFSRAYYSFHPSHIATPVIFIAAGIFAVMITGANRQKLTTRMMLPSGGTGGYLLWAESAIPIKENLNGLEGKKEFGFDEPELREIEFLQAKRLNGDDASCLNLNHVSTPPILGIDPASFIKKGSFSFISSIKESVEINPWSLLNQAPYKNTIYGVADQTVLQWGLKRKTGDTLVFRAENGQSLRIVICGGLKSSVFQGYLLIGRRNFEQFFPSIAGSSIMLVDGNPKLSVSYMNIINERLAGYGISTETAGEKLASFFQVTNTYLDVFTVLGIFGMVLGIGGLGFILARNFNQRKAEFALMMATGYSPRQIKNLLLKDHLFILLSGIITGTIPALIATYPSIRSGTDLQWDLLIAMIFTVTIIGLGVLLLSIRRIQKSSLIIQLRKE